MTNIENYLLDVNSIEIPTRKFGDFLSGFSNAHEPFEKKYIWWNLLPIGGQIIFLTYALSHWWARRNPQRILVFKQGFVKQDINARGEVKSQKDIDFNNVKGILCDKTRQYTLIYGIRKYNCTSFDLSVWLSDNYSQSVLTGSYRNESEEADKYNYKGYACNAINNAWLDFAIDRFNQEFSTKGFVTFYAGGDKVVVAKDYIQVNDTMISPGFTYSLNNGCLILYPEGEKGSVFKRKKRVVIHVAKMYNKEIFLSMVGRLHGIR